MLEQLRQLNKTLQFILQRLDTQHAQQSSNLSQMRDLVDGFTSGGACFNAYQVDSLTQAYLAIMGPLVAAKLAAPGQPTALPEMMKGSLMLAKSLVEELSAYRSQRQGLDYLEEQGAFIQDPWNKPQQAG